MKALLALYKWDYLRACGMVSFSCAESAGVLTKFFKIKRDLTHIKSLYVCFYTDLKFGCHKVDKDLFHQTLYHQIFSVWLVC